MSHHDERYVWRSLGEHQYMNLSCHFIPDKKMYVENLNSQDVLPLVLCSNLQSLYCICMYVYIHNILTWQTFYDNCSDARNAYSHHFFQKNEMPPSMIQPPFSFFYPTFTVTCNFSCDSNRLSEDIWALDLTIRLA